MISMLTTHIASYSQNIVIIISYKYISVNQVCEQSDLGVLFTSDFKFGTHTAMSHCAES